MKVKRPERRSTLPTGSGRWIFDGAKSIAGADVVHRQPDSANLARRS